MVVYADYLINCLVIAGMFQHNSKYYRFLCGSCTDKCIEHWTTRTQSEVEFSHVASESRSSVTKKKSIETATAVNEFSMDRVPGLKSTSDVMNKSGMSIVLEDEEMEEEEPKLHSRSDHMNKSNVPHSIMSLSNDFVLQETMTEHSNGDSKKSMNFDFGIYLEYWRRDRKNYVIPKYRSLKEELTKNAHYKITDEQYARLQEDGKKYLSLELKANDIGIGNKICRISPGSPITMHHLMALKLYTDFDDLQREFKRHCRRLRKGEPVESVMERNQEIAIWSRLIRESIMFWGTAMTKKQEFYCGLTARLVLRSLNQRFECALSTTRSWNIAQQFTGDYQGLILKIKRANLRTRYLDVAPMSAHHAEEESLFVGSTIKITGIFTFNDIRRKWETLKPKYFVAALTIFEQFYNGHFIDAKAEPRALLLKLLGLAIANPDERSMW